MIKKIDLLREAYHRRDYHTALGIASRFFTGLSREERNIFRKAAECSYPMTADLYRSMGVDLKASVKLGVQLLRAKYINRKKKKPHAKRIVKTPRQQQHRAKGSQL